MDSVKVLISIIHEKLKSLVNRIDSYNVNEQEFISRILEVAKELKENPFLIGEHDFRSELDSYLKELDDDKLLSQVIDDLSVLEIVCGAKKRGINVVLCDDEVARINRISDALIRCESVIKEKDEKLKKQKSADQVLRSKYSTIYDKLIAGENGLDHFTDSDIDLLMELISDKEFNFKFNVLEYIRAISEKINDNIINYQEEDELSVTNEVLIEEDIIRDLFIKYGYQFDGMPDKFKRVLQTKCKVQKLIDIFEYLELNPEYSFLKDYGKLPKGSACRAQFKKLVLLLRYATVETLDYILNDSKTRGVSLDDIFEVEGVFKHVSKTTNKGITIDGGENNPSDELSLTGTFEYYKGNTIIFDELSKEYQMKFNDPSIDLYKSTLLECPDVFKRNPKLIKKNIELAKLYKLDFLEKNVSTYSIKSASFLTAGSFVEHMDLLLENRPLYSYITKYPSMLKEDNNIMTAVYFRLMNLLEFDSAGRVKDVRRSSSMPFVNMSHLNEFRNNIPSKFVSAANNSRDIRNYINDDVCATLNSTIDNSVQKGLTFNLNGVSVSKYKFYRVWTSIMKVYNSLSEKDKKNYDFNQLILYALTYNSCYSVSEFEELKRFVNDMNYGGKTR